MTGQPTRRRVLAGTASVAAGLSGCVGSLSGSEPVSILAAGSLQSALADSLAGVTAEPLSVEAHGSRHAARLLDEGQRDPDIVALADTSLFADPLSTPWYATFAGNALVVAYNPDSDAGQRVPEADRWVDPLLDSSFRFGRTDPELDPLGYRTLLALELAEQNRGDSDLRERVREEVEVYPETQLLAQFEADGLDGAVVYRNMAVEREYPYRELPTAVDLSDPERADKYATATVPLPDGTRIEGQPIAFGATARSDRDVAVDVFETLVASTDEYLPSHGFVDRAAYPTYHGDVPDRIET